MVKKKQIRITEHQYNQINILKDSSNSVAHSDIMDILLSSQRRVESLENIIRSIHSRTLL